VRILYQIGEAGANFFQGSRAGQDRGTISRVKRPLVVLACLLAAAILPALPLRYYFSPECGSCRDFLDREVPRVEKAVGQKISLELRDIRLPGVLEELTGLLAARGLALTTVPVLFAGDVVLAGGKRIAAGFEGEVRRLLAGEAGGGTTGGPPCR
jgi:hypothetical protein